MATRMQTFLIGLAGAAALAGVASAAFYVGAKRAEVPTTRLVVATCGLVPSPAPLDLPLAALMGKAGTPGLTLGPILHPGLDAPLSVHFRPLAEGQTPQPEQANGRLVLPVDPARLPDEIRLSCRYGAVARVDYRRGPLRHPLQVQQIDPAPEAPALSLADPGTTAYTSTEHPRLRGLTPVSR